MTAYTPEETILRDICVTSMRMDGGEFDRFIAKTKADALRAAARAGNIDAASALYLHDRANQIEDTTP